MVLQNAFTWWLFHRVYYPFFSEILALSANLYYCVLLSSKATFWDFEHSCLYLQIDADWCPNKFQPGFFLSEHIFCLLVPLFANNIRIGHLIFPMLLFPCRWYEGSYTLWIRKEIEEILQCWPSWPQPDSAKGKFSYGMAPARPPGIVLCNPTKGAVEQCKKRGFSLRLLPPDQSLTAPKVSFLMTWRLSSPGLCYCNSTMGAVEQCKKEHTGIKRGFSLRLL